jgi:hypothetical protein
MDKETALSAVDLHRGERPAGSFAVVSILAACIVQLASNCAQAQCAPRDILHRQLAGSTRVVESPQSLIKSASDVAAWKTITIGDFAAPLALRNRLDELGCHVGGQAAEILARPAFTLASHKATIELVLVTPAQLGFTANAVTLADVYARARKLGLELATAEVGPQLRIQYPDQPMGEFLTVAMEPITTWSGEPIILNVANGGAGLILIGQDGRPEAELPAASRLVFARQGKSAPASELASQASPALPEPRRASAP